MTTQQVVKTTKKPFTTTKQTTVSTENPTTEKFVEKVVTQQISSNFRELTIENTQLSNQPLATTECTEVVQIEGITEPGQAVDVLISQFFTTFNLTITSEILTSYGCWCSKPLTGQAAQGAPLDDLDRICKQWSTCTRCERFSSCSGSVTDDFSVEYCGNSNDYRVFLVRCRIQGCNSGFSG